MGLEIDIAWLTVLLFGSLGLLLGARSAYGVLHRKPRDDLFIPVRKFGHPQHDAGAHLPVHDGLPVIRGTALHFYGGHA